jgi:DNA-binding response OmpR family regulator
MKILIIEDSPPTRDLLRRSLEREGHDVTAAARKSTGARLARENTYDLLIVDLMLPDGSGLEICRELRDGHVGSAILILTARGEVGDRIEGLDAGADDYLRKPFALAELHARVRALGRRGTQRPSAPVAAGGVRIDFRARHLQKDGEEVPLTAREWAVLEYLANRSGRVVPRTELLESIWDDTSDAASSSLDVILSRLRRKLKAGSGSGCTLRTLRGEGLLFETAEV